MLVVFSFCHKDADQALRQAQWVKELGGVKMHTALVVCNGEAKRQGKDKAIVEILSQAFSFVDSFTPFDQVEEGWPKSPNHMWIRTVQHIRDFKGDVPFLWMEADATPTSSDWVDLHDIQFKACQKPFMGDYVLVEGVPPHMSGVAVYYKTWLHAPSFSAVDGTAWDVALSRVILPLYHRTQLIQHEWKPDSFKTAADLKRLRDGAVIYHQCKDGSLIERLREQRGGVTAARQESLPASASSTLAPATREAELLAQIEALKAQLSQPKQKRGVRMKQRTPAQIAADKERMAKVRAGRMKNAVN